MDRQQALHILTAMQFDRYWREHLDAGNSRDAETWAEMRDRHLLLAFGHTKADLQRIQDEVV